MSEILRVEGITKRFSGAVAVANVSFSLRTGEVLAILGENGAGKSTLTKIICGALRPDEGSIMLDGKKRNFKSTYDATAAGISMVYQELSLVGGLSVAENIFMNSQPVNWFNKIQWAKLYSETKEYLEKFNLNMSPKLLVKRLPMGKQQLLEILKALSSNPKVLILDEPTSSLTEVETELLFRSIERLKKNGMSFIYITHKLSEVFAIADQAIIMRDGNLVGSKPIEHVTQNELVTMMVGRELHNLFGKEDDNKEISDGYYFEVKDLTKRSAVNHISFGLSRGEILGFAGLVGAGRTEVAQILFGINKQDSGTVKLNGKQLKINSPSDAIRNHIAYLTEDRKELGLYLRHSIKANLVAPTLRNYSNRLGIMRKKKINKFASTETKRFSIACSSINQKVMSLSGGNQQKCLISMWMGADPDVMILDEPTRGVDVGARSEIYSKIKEYVAKGHGAIVISSELPELIGLCDRILVMHEGKITGEVYKGAFSEEKILAFATGIEEAQ